MTLDGFLTFMTLLVGALTFMPSVMRLRLQVAVGWWILWTAMGLVAVLYFEFFQAVALGCPVWPGWLAAACSHLPAPGPNDGSTTAVTSQQWAFLVVLVWGFSAALGMWRPRVRGGSMSALARLADKLAYAGRWAELMDLLQPNLTVIDAYASRRRRRQRAHDWLSPPMWQITGKLALSTKALSEDSEPEIPKWLIWRLRVGAWVQRCSPSWSKPQQAAADILRMLSRKDLLNFMLDHRPSFGAALLPLQSMRETDFTDRFLAGLMSRKGGALYEEIEASRESNYCGYELGPDATILRALLADANVADDISAYKPIAEWVESHLNPVYGLEYCRSLNLPWDQTFHEQGQWRDPVVAEIHFFDIMVHAAAVQNVPSHMWVYYMRDLAEALLARYDASGVDVDQESEWPIRASYMLYSIVDVLRDWIDLPSKLPCGSYHSPADGASVDDPENNIPMAAAVTLGEVFKLIVMSDRLSDGFKSYLLDVAIRRLNFWSATGELSWVRSGAIAAIARGGTIDGNYDYRGRLCEIYESLEKPWVNMKDFEAAIGYRRRPIGPKVIELEAAGLSSRARRGIIGRLLEFITIGRPR